MRKQIAINTMIYILGSLATLCAIYLMYKFMLNAWDVVTFDSSVETVDQGTARIPNLNIDPLIYSTLSGALSAGLFWMGHRRRKAALDYSESNLWKM